MAETYSITAEPREQTGKQVKRLRADGRIPVVLYGHKIKPLSLSVARGDLEKVYRQAGASTMVTVKLPKGEHNVLIHQIHDDPVTGKHLHADFYAVRMDEKIKTTIPITFENTETAPAVRELDGVLLTNLTELEIECLPADLPSEITVDVGGLETFEEAITVADINLGDKVTILTDPETNVATVQPPKTEEQLEAELAEEEAVTADDVEVEGEEGEEGAEGEEDSEGEGDDEKAAEGDAKGGDKKED